jgi:hypothetical protein
MKLMKKNIFAVLAAIAVVLGIGQTASALDYFAAPREVSFPWTVCNTIGTSTYTNGPIDTRLFNNRARMILLCVTNAGNAVVTANLQTSQYAHSNWVNCTGIAIATNYSVTLTNYYGGVSNAVTQVYTLPGIPTYPTTYSAGFATPYLAEAQATNTGPLALNYNAPTALGVFTKDQNQYMQIVWTVSGGTGATNALVGAELIGDALYAP